VPLLPILRYPHPILRRSAEPVTIFDGAVEALACDLLETMRAAPGIGITAPHCGVLSRLVVIELDRAVSRFANPRVVWTSPETARHPEGSVSLPGVVEEVERPARVRVAFQDLAGALHEVEADGLLAVCLQHEIDQLDGVFWLDRLSRLKRERVLKRYEKLRRGAADA